jgi:hypothetical protein
VFVFGSAIMNAGLLQHALMYLSGAFGDGEGQIAELRLEVRDDELCHPRVLA